MTFPPRAEDLLENDFKIEPEFIGDIAEVISQRTRRPIEWCEQNPPYEKVNSVRDLVSFFQHQQKAPE